MPMKTMIGVAKSFEVHDKVSQYWFSGQLVHYSYPNKEKIKIMPAYANKPPKSFGWMT